MTSAPKKPGIGDVPRDCPQGLRGFLQRMKETVETITGRRGGSVEALSASATNAQIIDKVNEIIGRLQ